MSIRNIACMVACFVCVCLGGCIQKQSMPISTVESSKTIETKAPIPTIKSIEIATPVATDTTPIAKVDNEAGSNPSVSFKEVAQSAGLDFVHSAFRWGGAPDPAAMMGAGVCWLDYDNDGWLDLYAVNSYTEQEAGRWQTEEDGLPTSALFKNNAGTFSDVSAETQTDLAIRGNGCVAADFNLDGHTDLFITTTRVNQLLWNNGDGTFSEGAEAAGLDGYGWQAGAAVGDLNGDQLPDMVVTSYVNMNRPFEASDMGFPNTHEGVRDLIYINLGNGADGTATFREVRDEVGLESWGLEYGLGVLLSDMDDDGDLDIFVANDTHPNRLYRNAPDRTDIGFILLEEGQMAAVDDTYSGMGIAGGDLDGNGQTDVVITNLDYQTQSLYLGDGRMQFSNALGAIGLNDFGVGLTSWGANWFDADHDGDSDLFIASGTIPIMDMEADTMLAHLYGNLSAEGQPAQLAEWSEQTGVAAIGGLHGRGSAVADYDNDGDLDIVIGSIGGALTLLQNQGTDGNWLMVDLGGFYPGAKLYATLPDGTEMMRELFAGSSYLSSDDTRVHFGLGTADMVDLRVVLPGGREIVREGIPANQLLKLTER